MFSQLAENFSYGFTSVIKRVRVVRQTARHRVIERVLTDTVVLSRCMQMMSWVMLDNVVTNVLWHEHSDPYGRARTRMRLTRKLFYMIG